MNELIALNQFAINGELQQTVNARELHAFLESKRKFSDWIKAKLERLRLRENKDYLCLSQSCETQRSDGQVGVAVSTEYFITLDTTKHLAMMEKTDKGKEVRDYFIECERNGKIDSVGMMCK